MGVIAKCDNQAKSASAPICAEDVRRRNILHPKLVGNFPSQDERLSARL